MPEVPPKTTCSWEYIRRILLNKKINESKDDDSGENDDKEKTDNQPYTISKQESSSFDTNDDNDNGDIGRGNSKKASSNNNATITRRKHASVSQPSDHPDSLPSALKNVLSFIQNDEYIVAEDTVTDINIHTNSHSHSNSHTESKENSNHHHHHNNHSSSNNVSPKFYLPLRDVTQKITTNLISAAIYDTSALGHPDFDSYAVASVTNLLDDIGNCIEHRFLFSFLFSIFNFQHSNYFVLLFFFFLFSNS